MITNIITFLIERLYSFFQDLLRLKKFDTKNEEEISDDFTLANFIWKSNKGSSVNLEKKINMFLKEKNLLQADFVVIGYSFPPYNREVDEAIISELLDRIIRGQKRMSKLNVYIQCPEETPFRRAVSLFDKVAIDYKSSKTRADTRVEVTDKYSSTLIEVFNDNSDKPIRKLTIKYEHIADCSSFHFSDKLA